VSHRLVAAQIRSSPSAQHRELGEDLSLLKTIENTTGHLHRSCADFRAGVQLPNVRLLRFNRTVNPRSDACPQETVR
jgi:hypothetical protein